MSTASTESPADATAVRPQDYTDSPVHYAVATCDHTTLTKLLSTLPKLSDPTRIHTETESLAEERLAEQISAVLDGRDNSHRDTALHLAVRRNDLAASRAIAAAGANINLRNAAGWNPLEEALLRHRQEIAPVLVHHEHENGRYKWRRRRPRLIAALRRMRDFYMEISFHFESILPFVSKMAPSDTYKIWKRGGNLRADFSMSGFEGLNIKRGNNTILFINDEIDQNDYKIPVGSLLVIKHHKKVFYVAVEGKGAGAPLSDAEISRRCNKARIGRPGMDVSKAELIGCKNWRRQEKVEKVGEWKARAYEMHNVICSFRSCKVGPHMAESEVAPPQTSQLEFSIRPMIWLTEQFPLKTEELHRLLDILSEKIKAVRRMKEVITTTFPPGTYPVKVAIPVVPAVRLVISFTKFVELHPIEEFFTAPSSPRHDDQTTADDNSYLSFSSTRPKPGRHRKQKTSGADHQADPFVIPNGYRRIKGRL